MIRWTIAKRKRYCCLFVVFFLALAYAGCTGYAVGHVWTPLCIREWFCDDGGGWQRERERTNNLCRFSFLWFFCDWAAISVIYLFLLGFCSFIWYDKEERLKAPWHWHIQKVNANFVFVFGAFRICIVAFIYCRWWLYSIWISFDDWILIW